MRLPGRVALVTGAGSGIGKTCAQYLHDAGAHVVWADLNATANTEFLDVTDHRSWHGLLLKILSSKGRLDILVNAAGISLSNDTLSACTPDIWSRTMAVNLFGPVEGMKQVLPIMRRSGGGSIINIASVLARRGVGDAAAYSASKGGLVLATKCAALLCANKTPAIRVNSVSPGYIDTPLLSDWAATTPHSAQTLSEIAASIPMGHLGAAADVAELVVFLASNEAEAITGADFLIDGGFAG